MASQQQPGSSRQQPQPQQHTHDACVCQDLRGAATRLQCTTLYRAQAFQFLLTSTCSEPRRGEYAPWVEIADITTVQVIRESFRRDGCHILKVRNGFNRLVAAVHVARLENEEAARLCACWHHQRALRADHVHVTLVEFALAQLLISGAPDCSPKFSDLIQCTT